jgi:tetratricopeptide (TPR) repeat protein
VREVASILDIMPTVVDALGEEIPEGIQGVSLLPAVRGEGRIPDRTLYLESIYPNSNFGWAEVRAIRTPHMKFVDLPTPELYNLAEDKDEMDNLHEQAPHLARDAREEYRELTEALERSARTDADAAELDEEFRDRLLSLGYIAGTESKLVREDARDPKEVILLNQPVTNARGLVKERKYDEAIELLTRAIGTDPENKMGLVTLGRAYTGAQRIEEAKQIYRTALEIYPDSEELYRLLGWILIREEDYQGAADLMARLVHHSPRSAQAHYLYGFAYFRDKQWEKALAALSEAASLSRSFPKTHYLMAICYEQTGRRAEALEALDNYLKREPDVESLFWDPYFVDLKAAPEFIKMVRRYL